MHQQASALNRSVATEIPKSNIINANRNIRYSLFAERLNEMVVNIYLSFFSSTAPTNSIPAGGGELFEKFQRQKMNRESSVNSATSTDTWVQAKCSFRYSKNSTASNFDYVKLNYDSWIIDKYNFAIHIGFTSIGKFQFNSLMIAMIVARGAKQNSNVR